MSRFLRVVACLVVLANGAPLEKTLHLSAQSENAIVETAGASGDPVKTHVSTHSVTLDHGSAKKKIEVRITKEFVKKHVPLMVPVSTTPLPAHASEHAHLAPAHAHEHAAAAPPHIHGHERIAPAHPQAPVTAAPAHAHDHSTAAPVHHNGHMHVAQAHPHERAAVELAPSNIVAVHPHERVMDPSPHVQEHVPAPPAHPQGHVPAPPAHVHDHPTAAPLHHAVLHGESPVIINNASLSGVLHRILSGDIKFAHLSGKEVVEDPTGKHLAVVLAAAMHVIDLGNMQSLSSSHVATAHAGHNNPSLLASVLKPLVSHLKGHALAGTKHPSTCVGKTSHVLPGIVVPSTPKPEVAPHAPAATEVEQAPAKIYADKEKIPESQTLAADQMSSIPPPAEVDSAAVAPYAITAHPPVHVKKVKKYEMLKSIS